MAIVIWDCVRPLAPKTLWQRVRVTLMYLNHPTKGTFVMNLSGHNVRQKGVGLIVEPEVNSLDTELNLRHNTVRLSRA